MEYAMPIVYDLSTELDRYQWFCSLDAASGFWAVMVTERARHLSASVCAGAFECSRMTFVHKNAPMIYQQLVVNAFWEYVQPKGGWQDFATRIKIAEDETASRRATETTELNDVGLSGTALTNIEADCRARLPSTRRAGSVAASRQ